MRGTTVKPTTVPVRVVSVTVRPPWRRHLGIALLVVAGLGALLVAVGIATATESAERTVAFAFLGGSLMLLSLLVAPVVQFGGTGLLLSFGLLLFVPGLVGLFAVDAVEEGARTLYAGDDDGDGRVDEDPPGDADGSATDPTKIDSVQEALDHDDDDGDGKADEDPPPVTKLEPATEAAFAIGERSALALAVGGFAMIALFLVLQYAPSRRS